MSLFRLMGAWAFLPMSEQYGMNNDLQMRPCEGARALRCVTGHADVIAPCEHFPDEVRIEDAHATIQI